MNTPFQQRGHVYGWSEKRPLGNEKRPIGTAVTEAGAKRVYWKWEQETFPPGSRWYPKSMIQQRLGNGTFAWFLGTAQRK